MAYSKDKKFVNYLLSVIAHGWAMVQKNEDVES
jgi:hypothetical protein